MKNFAKDLWEKFGYKLIFLIFLMAFVGAIEGLGLILFVPFISLLNGSSSSKINSLYTQQIFATLGHSVWKLAGLIIGIFICQTIFSIVHGKLLAKLESSYVDIWRRQFITNLLKAKWSFFVENKTGQLLYTFGTETEQLGRAFLLLSQIVSAAILLVIYFLIVIYLSWKFSLLLITLGLLGFFLITRSFIKRAHLTGSSYAEHNSNLLGYVNEFISSAKMIKATSSENRVLSLCEKFLTILKKDYFGAVFYPYALKSILEFFIIMSTCISLVLLNNMGVTFVSMIIIIAVFLRLLPKLQSAQSSYQLLVGYLPSFASITSQLKTVIKFAEYENITTNFRDTFIEPVNIHFTNVSKFYGEIRALNKINFSVEAGSICAMVGPSGAGKSTLVDIIVKILQPDTGVIEVNGKSLQDLPTVNWRQSIGYVTQEQLLLHDTIWNNIAWGTSSCSEEDIIRAGKLANAHNFIIRLPHGYHTIIGERGSKLSGGQRQRIVLARALISKPALLILDEATSALDADSESAIVETISQLKGKVTILLVSHRLAPIRIADKIIFLENGSVTESGTWRELINLSGNFATLWKNSNYVT